MRSTQVVRVLSGLVVAGLVAGTALQAQNAAHAHVGHVADGFRGTPDGQGLLPTAVAEAEVAAQHAGFAASNPTDLMAMQRHMGHVIHALDPSVVENGPGAGYGVKAAAAGSAQHISLAANADGASDNVKTHATHISTASENVAAWADEAVALARQVEGASDAETALELVHELQEKLGAISDGTDANGDGRTGWQEGEGGLAQASQHLSLLQRGEGMDD